VVEVEVITTLMVLLLLVVVQVFQAMLELVTMEFQPQAAVVVELVITLTEVAMVAQV
jgi:hypothetical protein